MSKMSSAIALIALIGISSGCYHHHLRASGDPANSSPFKKTLDSSGRSNRTDYIVPPANSNAQGSSGLPSSADCKDNGLYEVGITSNWKDAAGAVFSFGRWSRVKVEWKCAKEPPVIGPRGLGPQPPASVEAARPAPPTTSVAAKPRDSKNRKDGFTKRTAHAFFWGAVQQNFLPPAPSATSKTPANCKSLRQVKLPMNYGYSLITVITAGMWSPMRVAWQCAEDRIGGTKVPAPLLPEATHPLSP